MAAIAAVRRFFGRESHVNIVYLETSDGKPTLETLSLRTEKGATPLGNESAWAESLLTVYISKDESMVPPTLITALPHAAKAPSTER